MTRRLSQTVQQLQSLLAYLRSRGMDETRPQNHRHMDLAQAAAVESALESMKRYKAEFQLGISAIGLLQRVREVVRNPPPTPSGRDLWEDLEQFLEEVDR